MYERTSYSGSRTMVQVHGLSCLVVLFCFSPIQISIRSKPLCTHEWPVQVHRLDTDNCYLGLLTFFQLMSWFQERKCLTLISLRSRRSRFVSYLPRPRKSRNVTAAPRELASSFRSVVVFATMQGVPKMMARICCFWLR